MRHGILGFALLGLARIGLAEADAPCGGRPIRDVRFVCDADCVVDERPEIGDAVRVQWEGPPGTTFDVAWWRGIWRLAPGALVCHWPGLARLRITTPPRIATVREPVREETVTAAVAKLARGSSLLRNDVWQGSPTPDEGDLLDEQFVDVVRVGSKCSGVAVGPRHVLTAAHCADGATVTADDGTARPVAEVRPAPFGVDAAILVVAADPPLGLPIRALSQDGADEASTGIVRVVGFGATSSDGLLGGGTRNFNDIAVGYWTCDAQRASVLGCLPGHEIVISGGGADACSGDSGGPLLDQHDGHWRLIGITTERLRTAGATCGSGGVYTHVGPLAEWITTEVER